MEVLHIITFKYLEKTDYTLIVIVLNITKKRHVVRHFIFILYANYFSVKCILSRNMEIKRKPTIR